MVPGTSTYLISEDVYYQRRCGTVLLAGRFGLQQQWEDVYLVGVITKVGSQTNKNKRETTK